MSDDAVPAPGGDYGPADLEVIRQEITGLHVEVARALAEDAGWAVREAHAETPTALTADYRPQRLTLFCSGRVVDRVEQG